MSYPYKVDYNDHFETPLVAYKDILPLLDAVGPLPRENSNKKKGRSKHVLYDPYYCDGRAARLLNELGFENVRHEKRDFYKDIKNNEFPLHHTFVTNPPYSGDHKEKCVRFAVDNLRNNMEASIPFFILMPNYIACRNHFRSTILSKEEGIDDPLDILYVVPSNHYEYEHPDGTGKDIPPFASIWFCGIPHAKLEAAKQAFRKVHGKGSVGLQGGRTSNSPSPKLLSSLQELKAIGAVPTQKRKNIKQRRREKRRREKESNPTTSVDTHPIEWKGTTTISADRLNDAKQRRREKRKKNGIDPNVSLSDSQNKNEMKSASSVKVSNAKQRRREKRRKEKVESSASLENTQHPQKQNQSSGSTKDGMVRNTESAEKMFSSTTIPIDRLKNAKQRRRDKRKRDLVEPLVVPEDDTKPAAESIVVTKGAKKKSKYRDENGVRTKRRY